MKKKRLGIIFAVVLALSLSVSAFAAPPPGAGYGCRIGICGGFMWDEDGSFVDRGAFEESLNQAIEDGLVRPEDRDFYFDRYDYCAEYGGAPGGRGGFGCRRGARGR